MKVLFAVSNDEISESIVKKYQKEYKEIISYKNVYYFNAILKEIQKDKSYDRIVISEELESFSHTQYDQIDKFIFDKLDSISDEASNIKGNDTPIILICADRRAKSEEMLVKLFGIGIYNALIGNDRSVEEVCKLIHQPRLKKEAKSYYKIDSEDVNYQAESENDVSEMEIQNILAHYKSLGKNEERYVDSFNNIAAQYNDTQLRIISKFLPLNVRAVLEQKSEKYQRVMSFNNKVSDSIRVKKDQKDGPSETLLKSKIRSMPMSKPVVIPSAVNMQSAQKLSKMKHNTSEEEKQIPPVETRNYEETNSVDEQFEDLILPGNEEKIENTNVVQEKKGRGRPRKTPVETSDNIQVTPVKKGRGRPRKNPIPEVEEEQFEDLVLPGNEEEVEEPILPGFEEVPQQRIENEEETVLPGFEDTYEDEPEYMPQKVEEYNSYEQNVDISRLITSDKKIVTFVGTSKNGTSFIVNNVAQILSSMGINTAILDTTQNRNSYYIYTKNEEDLRQIAENSFGNLLNGIAKGIQVNKNLAVYTSLPEENEEIKNAEKILETLVNNYSVILIDCDFTTPIGYFRESQETYLVQSMDILTIQPLTAFLRELKAKNVLDEKKLRIILNKAVKVRGVTEKTIIGGMAYYNDPAMSFMTELFDRNLIKYISVPFDEEVYIKYLNCIINCEIDLKGYTKNFMQILKELSSMVYPLVSGQGAYRPSTGVSNSNKGFTPSINNTLDEMKRKF